MTKTNVLHVSHAANVAPHVQQNRERGLLAAGGVGEAHLHVSTLAPSDVLSLGAFHREPRPTETSLWRRHTGGRAVPSGRGFALLTLTLPHRSALVGPDRLTLAPEQVMNRCVRGLLHAVRALGANALYPGLDLVTHERRAFAALSFVEVGGPTLFQAILATGGTFAEGPLLADRADPEGVVPITFMGPTEATCLTEILGQEIVSAAVPEALAHHLAAGYADAFTLDTRPLDDEATTVLADTHAAAPPLPPEGHGKAAHANGFLGAVDAWATVAANDTIESITLAGDFIATLDAPTRFSAALAGCPRTPEALEAAVMRFVDRDQGYFLGLRPAELVDLVQRSATLSP